MNIGSEHAIKPCRQLGYCPYGPLVEEFPISEKRTEKSCSVFGHDCPVYYVAEGLTDDEAVIPVDRPDWELFISDLIEGVD